MKMTLLRVKLAALSLLNPWRAVRQLRDENARLVGAISNPLLTGINIGNGTLEVGMEGGGPMLLAGMFLGLFEKYPDAKNFVEMTFGSPSGDVLVTVQRPNGKTPSQLLKDAQRELSECRAELEKRNAK